jgi:type II/III secretion system protein
MAFRWLRLTALAATLLLVAAFSPVVVAQENPPAAKTSPTPPPVPARRGPRPGDVQKVFVLKYVRVDDMARLLSVFPAEISGSDHPELRALAVSAAPAVVAAIEETVKRLDVPPAPTRSVELTGYVLRCSDQGGDTAGTSPELQDVVAQLKKTFHSAGCRLSDTIIARGQDDGSLSAAAKGAEGRSPGEVDWLDLRSSRIRISPAEGGGSLVRLQNLRFRAGLGKAGANDPSLDWIGPEGDISVRDGDKVVVGKSGGTAAGQALILVLTAHVVD